MANGLNANNIYLFINNCYTDKKSRLQSSLKSLFYFIKRMMYLYVFRDMPINFPHLSIQLS